MVDQNNGLSNRCSEYLTCFEALQAVSLKNTRYRILVIIHGESKKLMPFQIQISREFHYGTLSIPIGIQRTDLD